jgi:pyrimidine-specific ribonucleoside hydrolase
MGEVRDEDDEDDAASVLADWSAHLGQERSAEALRHHALPLTPAGVEREPLIIDTDLGGDPDDAVALVLAARRVRELALVVTSDERDGARAGLARRLLDLAGRPEVPVVTGIALDSSFDWVADGLAPAGELPLLDLASEVRRVLGDGDGRARWLGIGPPSNLARLLLDAPDLVARLRVTQMGGALRYRDPGRAQHNFRLDPGAAQVLGRLPRPPHLVTSDITYHPALQVSAESPLYQRLVQHSTTAPWAALLRSLFERWFERRHPASHQHDALTLAAALRLPFVTFAPSSVEIAADGQLRELQEEPNLWICRTADRPLFMTWLSRVLFEDGAL